MSHIKRFPNRRTEGYKKCVESIGKAMERRSRENENKTNLKDRMMLMPRKVIPRILRLEQEIEVDFDSPKDEDITDESNIEDEFESDEDDEFESDEDDELESDKDDELESDKDDELESDKEDESEKDEDRSVETKSVNNSLASDKEEVTVASEKEVAVASEKEVAVASEKEVAVASEKEVAVTSEKEVAVTSEKEVAVASDKEVTVASEKEVAVTSEKEVAVTSEKEVAVTSEKEVAVASKKEVAVASEKEVAVASEKEVDQSVRGMKRQRSVLNREQSPAKEDGKRQQTVEMKSQSADDPPQTQSNHRIGNIFEPGTTQEHLEPRMEFHPQIPLQIEPAHGAAIQDTRTEEYDAQALGRKDHPGEILEEVNEGRKMESDTKSSSSRCGCCVWLSILSSIFCILSVLLLVFIVMPFLKSARHFEATSCAILNIPTGEWNGDNVTCARVWIRYTNENTGLSVTTWLHLNEDSLDDEVRSYETFPSEVA